MDVIIFSGQSNMQGQTEGLPAVNTPVENALEYRLIGDKVIPLLHPVGEELGGLDKHTLGSHQGGGSLVPAFCSAYTKKSGKKVVAIHVARGSTTIAEWQKGTQRYHAIAEKIRYGLKKAEEIEKVEKIYFVWLQGESDAIIGTETDKYLHNLIQLKNDLKADFGIDKFGIIKVGYFFCISSWHTHVSTYEKKRVCDEKIMQAQEIAVSQDSDFVMLTRVCPEFSQDAKYINPDASGHYNNATMDVIGELAGSALATL